MAVRKSMSSTIVVDGDRADWLGRCELALTAAGFKNLSIDRTTHVLGADYHKAMTWETFDPTLRPADGDLRTEIAKRLKPTSTMCSPCSGAQISRSSISSEQP